MVIMTHGGFGTVASFNKYYTIEDVFQHFTDKNCPSLKGKPRLFFIQACRGEKIDVGHVMKIDEERKYKLERAPFGVSKEENDAGPTVVETERIDSLHEPFNHEHYLIVRSTMPDYASFRDPVKGSWFIQSLCNELVCNGHHFDILTLLTSVNLAVQEYESNPNKEKQILTISSMLTKILIFDIKERKVRTESEEMDWEILLNIAVIILFWYRIYLKTLMQKSQRKFEFSDWKFFD